MGSRLLIRSKSKSRDLWDLALRLLLIAAVLALVAAPARAQEAVEGNDENELLVKDLDWKSKVILNKLGEDAASNGLVLESGLGVFDAFFASLSMIVVSEIGDETFIIAALMAMRLLKSIVLSGPSLHWLS